MSQRYAKELLERYKTGQCTTAEKEQVENWVSFGSFPEFKLSELELEEQINSMARALPLYKGNRLWPRIAVAAAILFTLGIGFYFYNIRYSHLVLLNSIEDLKVNDIAPGKQGATLTLASGKKIRLSNAVNGILSKEAGIIITKTKDGQLLYEVNPSLTRGADQSYNTLSTAKGETYQVRLPDGSLVYLNAASTLSYPASLMENGKRVVKLSGEGYFEVFKDKTHPFVVKTNKQEIEVLGTHFNVNGYEDDAVEKTTLLEGKVKMTASGNSVILNPGQEGKVDGGTLNVSDVDNDWSIAWKNNEFMFESERIETVMKMVERWYNVEVVYIGNKTNEKFSGEVSRFDKVSKVLGIIESTGAAHFKIEGRKIYVL